MMAWRSCVSSLGPFIGPCSRLVPPSCVFLVYACHSKQAAAFLIYPVSPLASCPVPSKPPTRCPRCLIRFVHPSRPRLASRRPSRSHAVSPIVPFLVPSRRARCVERLASRLAVAPFCSARLAILPMLCRPLVASWLDDAGRARIPHHATRRASQGNEETRRTPIWMIWSHSHAGTSSSHTRKTIRRMKRKTRRASKTTRRDDEPATRDRTRRQGERNKKNEASKQARRDEGRDDGRDE